LKDWLTEPADAPFDVAGWGERIAALYLHWRRIRPAPDLLPGRQHFDPIDLPRVLPSIWLLDIQREPFRLRYRLVGTNLVTVHGRDFTGQWYDEARPMLNTVAPDLLRYREMAGTGLATWRRGRPILVRDPHWHTTENVMMPLASDGKNADMMLCASTYYGHDGRAL
jgi:hypothetical protein